jgi:hypothetical protein
MELVHPPSRIAGRNGFVLIGRLEAMRDDEATAYAHKSEGFDLAE